MKTIKIFEAFAGYGGASFALKNVGIDFECVGYSEIDKYAIECYEQNHFRKEYPLGTGVLSTNFGDITNIDPKELPDFDLFTGGFPCQAFSVAGKGKGELDARGTLFYDIIRICEVKKPKYILLENVKGLTNKRHKETFDKILSELDRIGYYVFWKVLNTKNYGVPQNRDRVFFICFRKDQWPNHGDFEFPKEEELKLFLKDILEEDVDEKYYLSEEQIKRLLERTKVKIPELNEPSCFDVYNKKVKMDRVSITLTEPHHNNLRLIEPKVIVNVNPSGKGMNGNVYAGDIAPTITTNKGEGNKIIQLNNPTHSNNRIYSEEGLSPTLNTMNGGNRQPFICRPVLTPDRLNKRQNGRRFKEDGDPSFTITAQDRHGVLVINGREYFIRKLTPKECFRLMGFLNDEINVDGISNSQQYKLAGNGWDINLVSKILKNMITQFIGNRRSEE